MTRRFNFLFALTLGIAFLATSLTAQPLSFEEASNDEISILTKETKTPYPPKPKDMWEISLHGGLLGVGADTPNELFPGFGLGLGVRKSLSYTWSLRGDFLYGRTTGLDYSVGGGATTPIAELTAAPLNYSGTNGFVFNYQATYISAGLQAVFNLTNIKFHGNASKLGIYGFAGLGVFTVDTKYDALDAAGQPYNFTTMIGSASSISDIRTNLNDGLDGEYETEAAVLKLNGEEVVYNPNLQIGLGLAYRFSNRISLSIEPQVHFTTNDFIDGRKFRSSEVPSGASDVVAYVPIRLGIFLGDTKKKSLPLYWVNPLDKPMEAIAANTKKKDAAEMLVDKDNDGVPDLIDKEQDTPAGADVDTRGVTLDSDKDGLPNHLDKEPYSPTGYKIDPSTGIAEKPKMPKVLTDADIINIGKQQGWDKKPVAAAGITDWFLPMIHFDNDRYSIKSQSYSALDQVATVMTKYPNLTVVAEGHASSEASDAYNRRLSYKRANAAIDYLVTNYGISRSRFILTYDGESKPLVKSAPTNYMNRRVEFRAANGETQMSAPQ
jgi:OOP family OmpA-OmpF porin